MQICISNLDQVIELAENWKWARDLNLFRMTRVKGKNLIPDFKISPSEDVGIPLEQFDLSFIQFSIQDKTVSWKIVTDVFFVYFATTKKVAAKIYHENTPK